MMIQQQVFVLNNIFILLDALSVIFAGYAAVAVQRILSKGAWTIDIVPFVSAVWVMLCLTNYLIGNFGLYSDRRFKVPVQIFLVSLQGRGVEQRHTVRGNFYGNAV